MGAFDLYTQNAFGHPVVGYDDEVGGPALWGGRKALAYMRRRRQLRGDELGDGVSMDVIEAEDEVGAALDDDDDDDDDDDLGEDDLGGRGKSLDDLRQDLRKLKAKRNKANTKAALARTGIGRRVWGRKVERLDRKISKVQAKIAFQQDLRAPLSPVAQRGGASGQGSRGVLPRGITNLDVLGRVLSPPRAGRQVSVPLLFSGVNGATATWAAAATAGTSVAFSGQTAQITYARFKLVGLRVNAWLSGDNGTAPYTVQSIPVSCQARILINTLQADGYPNALYGAQIVSLGGSFGVQSAKEIVDGIRDNSFIERNNVISVSGSIDNPFDLGTGVEMAVYFSLEAMLNVIDDDLFGEAP